MTELAIATILFIVAFGAILLGLRVRRVLPRRYADEATMASVKEAVGQMAILATVVLGFVTASAKSNFDASSTLIADSAMRFVTLDRILAGLGPRATDMRAELKQILERQVTRMRSSAEVAESDAAIIERTEEYEAFYRRLASFEPESDLEATDLRRARDLMAELLRSRWMFRLERAGGVPMAFLLFVLVWLAVDFFYVGLNATDNAFVILTAVFVALSVASAMFLMLELEGPASGVIRVSPEPLERALAILGR
jgi:hypothetical protein